MVELHDSIEPTQSQYHAKGKRLTVDQPSERERYPLPQRLRGQTEKEKRKVFRQDFIRRKIHINKSTLHFRAKFTSF